MRSFAGRMRRQAARGFPGRIRRRVAASVLGRISMGTARDSPWIRRGILVAALLGVALTPYPMLGTAAGLPAVACGMGAGPAARRT